jgi:hypothetical protein
LAGPALTGARERLHAELRSTGLDEGPEPDAASEFDLALAGSAVRLRFATPALRAFAQPALAHLATEIDGEPDLVIELREGADGSDGQAASGWDEAGQGIVRETHAPGVAVVYDFLNGCLYAIDAPRGRAWFWAPDAAALSHFERAGPLRGLVRLWAEHRGLVLAHASAVAGPSGGAVLIAGRGGIGKSSTAAAAIGAGGLRFVADDMCLVEPRPRSRVHSVFSVAKLGAATLARLPRVAPLAGPLEREDEKAIVFLHDRRPEWVARDGDLRALAIPRVRDQRETTLSPLPGSAALRAAAPSTLFFMPGASEQVLAQLAGLVRAVPCYRLDVGRDPDSTAAALASLTAAS